MAVFQDFLRTELEGGSPLIKNGDFVIGPSDSQHIADIINVAPGWYHQFPSVGCFLAGYQDGNINTTQLASLIMTQLKNDGYTVNRPKITLDPSGNLNVIPNAYRK